MSYIAKSNIIHNGVSYVRGQEVTDLSESEARRLCADGVLANSEKGEEVIVEPKVEDKTPSTDEEKKDEDGDDDLDSDDDDFIPEGFENHVVTEQDLLDNPDLAEKGTKVGDTIQRAKVEPEGADLSGNL
jgi:hypothetical protein